MAAAAACYRRAVATVGRTGDDAGHKKQRSAKKAESRLAGGVACTFVFGGLWVSTGAWFWLFPLAFVGLAPTIEGLLALRRVRSTSASELPKAPDPEHEVLAHRPRSGGPDHRLRGRRRIVAVPGGGRGGARRDGAPRTRDDRGDRRRPRGVRVPGVSPALRAATAGTPIAPPGADPLETPNSMFGFGLLFLDGPLSYGRLTAEKEIRRLD